MKTSFYCIALFCQNLLYLVPIYMVRWLAGFSLSSLCHGPTWDSDFAVSWTNHWRSSFSTGVCSNPEFHNNCLVHILLPFFYQVEYLWWMCHDELYCLVCCRTLRYSFSIRAYLRSVCSSSLILDRNSRNGWPAFYWWAAFEVDLVGKTSSWRSSCLSFSGNFNCSWRWRIYRRSSFTTFESNNLPIDFSLILASFWATRAQQTDYCLPLICYSTQAPSSSRTYSSPLVALLLYVDSRTVLPH